MDRQKARHSEKRNAANVLSSKIEKKRTVDLFVRGFSIALIIVLILWSLLTIIPAPHSHLLLW